MHFFRVLSCSPHPHDHSSAVWFSKPRRFRGKWNQSGPGSFTRESSNRLFCMKTKDLQDTFAGSLREQLVLNQEIIFCQNLMFTFNIHIRTHEIWVGSKFGKTSFHSLPRAFLQLLTLEAPSLYYVALLWMTHWGFEYMKCLLSRSIHWWFSLEEPSRI